MSKGYNYLGDRIKKLREINDYTQTELGKVLNLPKQSISRIEKGRRKISPEELEKISKFFHTPSIFILKEGWIDNEYEDSRPKNRWGIRVPQFIEDFLEGLGDYFEYSLDYNKRFDSKTIKKIIRDTTKALKDISEQYENKDK